MRINRRIFAPTIALAIGLPSASRLSQAQANEQRVSGIVLDSAGEPVPYVYLSINGSRVAISDGGGKFQFLARGSHNSLLIGARKIGLAPLDTLVEAGIDENRGLRIRMRHIASQLDTVTVSAKKTEYDDYLDRSGLYQRMARNVDGTFLTSRDIEKRNSLTLTGVLRDVNGVRVVSRGGRGGKNDFVLGRGGLCALGMVLDGQRVELNNPPIESIQPRITSIIGSRPVQAIETRKSISGAESLDQLINLSGVAAVEIYPSAASVPNSLQHHAEGCGLIVVWTNFH